jgi:hypothetical protein
MLRVSKPQVDVHCVPARCRAILLITALLGEVFELFTGGILADPGPLIGMIGQKQRTDIFPNVATYNLRSAGLKFHLIWSPHPKEPKRNFVSVPRRA